MSRAPTRCVMCPRPATRKGRCDACQVKPWRNPSPSSTTLARSSEHRRERAAARRRAKGRCEECGRKSDNLDLHHPDPISKGGAVVQPDARLLCPICHLDADRAAGVRR